MKRDTNGEWKKFLTEEELKAIENLCSGKPVYEQMRSRALSRRKKQQLLVEFGPPEPKQVDKHRKAKDALLEYGYTKSELNRVLSAYPEDKEFSVTDLEKLKKYGTLDEETIKLRIEHKLNTRTQFVNDPVKLNDVVNKITSRNQQNKIRLAKLNS